MRLRAALLHLWYIVHPFLSHNLQLIAALWGFWKGGPQVNKAWRVGFPAVLSTLQGLLAPLCLTIQSQFTVEKAQQWLCWQTAAQSWVPEDGQPSVGPGRPSHTTPPSFLTSFLSSCRLILSFLPLVGPLDDRHRHVAPSSSCCGWRVHMQLWTAALFREFHVVLLRDEAGCRWIQIESKPAQQHVFKLLIINYTASRLAVRLFVN